jgi:hypothetical protein
MDYRLLADMSISQATGRGLVLVCSRRRHVLLEASSLHSIEWEARENKGCTFNTYLAHESI